MKSKIAGKVIIKWKESYNQMSKHKFKSKSNTHHQKQPHSKTNGQRKKEPYGIFSIKIQNLSKTTNKNLKSYNITNQNKIYFLEI